MPTGQQQPPDQDATILAQAADALARGEAAMQAGLPVEAERWFGRCSRLAPQDDIAALLHARALASIDPASALACLRRLINRQSDWQAPLLLLAACLHAAGDFDLAATALASCLQVMSCPGDPAFPLLANRIAGAVHAPGWLGLARAGTILASGATSLLLDGVPLLQVGEQAYVLPAGWRHAAHLHGASMGRPLLGSPIDVRRLVRLTGTVAEAASGQLTGWVAASGAADEPLCVDVFEGGSGRHLARAIASLPAGEGALPWALGFQVPADALPPDWRALRVSATDSGTTPVLPADGGCEAFDLLGSVLHRDARLATTSAVALACSIVAPDPALGRPARRRGAVRVNRLHVLALAPGTCGQEEPHAVAALSEMVRGDFACRLNAGWRQAASDVLLLRPGTRLSDVGMARVQAAATAVPRVATVSALHTGHGVAGLSRDGVDDATLTALVSGLPGAPVLRLPVPDGPCILIRREALADIGLAREGVFGETSGALADFAARATSRGWCHLAACDVLVPSADDTAQHDASAAGDWLFPARHAIDSRLWARGRRRSAVILVTHAAGGGIERHVLAHATEMHARGVRPIIVRPIVAKPSIMPLAAAAPGWAVSEPGGLALPDLIFPAAAGLAPLAALLRPDRPTHVEYHHAGSHHPAIESLSHDLAVPHDVFVHDYASFCPRVTLLGGAGRYCGEPAELRDCQDCIEDHGARLPDAADVGAWRARSASLLHSARRVTAPTEDAARRITRYFPAVTPRVAGWTDDEDQALAPPAHPTRRSATGLHVALLGALTQEKGFAVLLACARDAARRDLPLRFTLVGHSVGDARLLATGRVFVTGPFQEGEGLSLLAKAAADIALLPSVWPETWSYALSDLWRAGLWVVAFDLGAPAARIRAKGGGTLMPPGLPPARLNDSLLGLLFRGQGARHV